MTPYCTVGTFNFNDLVTSVYPVPDAHPRIDKLDVDDALRGIGTQQAIICCLHKSDKRIDLQISGRLPPALRAQKAQNTLEFTNTDI